MKLVVRILLGMMIPVEIAAAMTPVTSIGSNPWYSTELYPQDLLLRQGSYFYYNPRYQNSPFWGDIDEPANKPKTNVDYTQVGAHYMDGEGSFNYTGSVHTMFNNFGYAYRYSDKVMTSVELNSDIVVLYNLAEGNFTGDHYPDGATMPFHYEMVHSLGTFTGRAMLASYVRDIPFGVTVEGGMNRSLGLSKEVSFAKFMRIDSITYDPDSLVHYDYTGDRAKAHWGFAIPGCNHILVERGTQGDSWFQNEYALGPVYHFNLSSGITLSTFKAGGSFRMIYGHQTQYLWRPDTGVLFGNDPELTERYVGRYVKDNEARLTWLGEGRLFGNYTLRKEERFSLNTFGVLSYSDSSVGRARVDNLNAVSSAKERVRSVGFECIPNVKANLGGVFNYIDLAALLGYRYSRYGNTTENGGVYQSSDVHDEWGDMWERFSYANENVFDAGADIAAMFPLFTEGNHRLSLNLRMVGDVRFTYQSRYYGNTPQNGSTKDFSIENVRRNYTRETMFNTALMLQYSVGPMQLRFQFVKPVLYSVLARTTVVDAAGNKKDGYPLEKSPQLISLQGLILGFYGSYDIVLPFLKR